MKNLLNFDFFQLEMLEKVGEGAYAQILVSSDQKVAYKLFTSLAYSKKKGQLFDEKLFLKGRKYAFNSEVEAYKIASNNQELALLTPNFLGKVQIEKGVKEGKEDRSTDFLFEMCYAMEYVPFTCSLKINEFVESSLDKKFNFNRKIIKAKFKKHGINSINDSSILFNEEEKSFKIVDFATEEWVLPIEDIPYL